MPNELLNLKTFFSNKDLQFSDVWLESCLEWCKQERLPPNYSRSDLQQEIYEQWLLLDLRDTEFSILPPNLSSEIHKILHGTYCLQIMEIVDISRPKLWQLQKIKNSHSLTRGLQEDAEIAGTGKRMLLLKLTDGVQEVYGMEYKPIPELNINIRPGSKIKLIGPLNVRRGRIMLESNQVKLLGGEVDDLLIPNAAENVLARSLGLPLNDNPIIIKEEKEVRAENETQRSTNGIQQNPTPPAQNIQRNSEAERRQIAEEMSIFMQSEMDTPMPLPINRTANVFEEPDFNFDEMEVDHFNPPPIGSNNLNRNLNQTLQDEDDDIFNHIDFDAHLDNVTKQTNPPSSSAVSSVSTAPTMPLVSIPTVPSDKMTLERIMKNKNQITKGVFKVKARFKSIEEKFSFDKDEYKMRIKIEDETCESVVRIHSDVLSNTTQLFPAEMFSLKMKILENDACAKTTVLEALDNMRKKIVGIDGIVEIQVSKFEEFPIITKILC